METSKITMNTLKHCALKKKMYLSFPNEWCSFIKPGTAKQSTMNQVTMATSLCPDQQYNSVLGISMGQKKNMGLKKLTEIYSQSQKMCKIFTAIHPLVFISIVDKGSRKVKSWKVSYL